MQLLCLLQILTHVKEKLQFAQKEKEGMQVELDSVEAALATHRDDLTRVKLVRDKAIVATRKLRDAGSQVTNTALLADLEVWDHSHRHCHVHVLLQVLMEVCSYVCFDVLTVELPCGACLPVLIWECWLRSDAACPMKDSGIAQMY